MTRPRAYTAYVGTQADVTPREELRRDANFGDAMPVLRLQRRRWAINAICMPTSSGARHHYCGIVRGAAKHPSLMSMRRGVVEGTEASTEQESSPEFHVWTLWPEARAAHQPQVGPVPPWMASELRHRYFSANGIVLRLHPREIAAGTLPGERSVSPFVKVLVAAAGPTACGKAGAETFVMTPAFHCRPGDNQDMNGQCRRGSKVWSFPPLAPEA